MTVSKEPGDYHTIVVPVSIWEIESSRLIGSGGVGLFQEHAVDREFSRQILSGDLNKSEAVVQAQLDLLTTGCYG